MTKLITIPIVLAIIIVFINTSVTAQKQPLVIAVDATVKGSFISPLLFGHNLEMTRRGSWSGLSAEMIANRKFAATSNQFPKHWKILGDPHNVRMDTTIGFAGKQSVRINSPKNGIPAGISQKQPMLAFTKGKSYAFKVWLKSTAKRSIRLQLFDQRSKPVFDKTLVVEPGSWFLETAEFKAKSTLTNAEFRITTKDQGSVWIGAISSMPNNAFHGMRRDVVDLLKSLQPGCLRFPGGCYAEFYQWKDGLLPRDQRPPIYSTGLDFLLRDTDDTDNHEIGIDEFMALCEELGAAPVITARLSENTPGNVADWIEYCNGDASTPWGRQRTDRGHAKPYQVRWWFVGNELYYFGRGEATGAANAASLSAIYSRAMKKADSSIQLVATTKFGNGELSRDWNEPLLTATANSLSAVSTHQYLDDQISLDQLTDLSTLISAPMRNTLPMLSHVRRYIDSLLPAKQRTAIIYDEWNTRWGIPGNVPMGLYTASILNMLCREAGPLGVEMACYFMPVNEGAITVKPLSASLDAAGYVFELYKVHQGNYGLPIAQPKDLDVFASVTPDRHAVYITLVNNIAQPHKIVLSLTSGMPDSATAIVKRMIPRSLKLKEKRFNRMEEKLHISEGNLLVFTVQPGEITRVAISGL
ncbi:carbohydrate binding domain-containing protein [Flavihumibacter profundi]|jgi:hypothetical protein|uniref:carbohydrate binding domain-containing protein n=1 Tax=Flavihumibacter profundi TaxID=2716883 RepID=UPI001CC68270|nr:carbohydrate binding domain-containing protein [Flavihumibacter profundi]MBZ5855489.1 carbohydrate binding domain-containing protein [Flavihumibacter profundi]